MDSNLNVEYYDWHAHMLVCLLLLSHVLFVFLVAREVGNIFDA